MSDYLAIARQILAAQPFSVLVGTEVIRYGDGAVELRMPIQDIVRQQHGFVHGGVVAYLADNALTMAAGLSMGGGVLTAEMKINYLKPAVGEVMIARAWTISHGRSQGVSRCDVFVEQDGVERLCAAAQGTVMKSHTKSAVTPPPGTKADAT
ncbi:PaaI family thioesterase [Aquidulcibacter sp.]|jgi:uncharacterized protein (TIGR00369 family)|uniref:PaaI family thioesterase n=1 Tax=Aquidulcibacter sp. TaxID=2052990 RepID=UPI00394FDC98